MCVCVCDTDIALVINRPATEKSPSSDGLVNSTTRGREKKMTLTNTFRDNVGGKIPNSVSEA